MLESVSISGNGYMSFPMEDVDPNAPIVLTSISGLSSAKTTVRMSDFDRDGGYYQGRRAERKNPVFTFRLQADYANGVSVSELREQLYSLLLASRGDDFRLVTLSDSELPDREFSMVVESVESEMFAKESIVVVSGFMPDPYLRSAIVDYVEGPVVFTSVTNMGTVPAPFMAFLEVNIATPRVTLECSTTGQFMTVERDHQPGDQLVFSTQPGAMGVGLFPTGETFTGALTSASRFFHIPVGTSTITSYGSSVGDGAASIYHLSYDRLYWGI